MDTIVVGGGIAGIAAAARLLALGHTVRVVDPGPLGGLAQTLEPLPGWRIEAGPTTFLGRSRAVFELLGLLGLSEAVVPLAGGARYLRRGGRLRRFPFRLAELPGLLLGLFRRPESGPSVRDWFAARLGTSVADEVVGGLVTGIWATGPEALEMESCFPSLFSARSLWAAMRAPSAGRGTFTLRDGLGAIGAAAQLHHVATTVQNVERQGDRWVATTSEGALEAEALVVAVPGWTLRGLCPWLAAPEFAYSPILGAHWLSPDAAFPRGFGYLAGPREGAAVLGTLFTSSIFPGRAPAGLLAGATLLGGTRDPAAVELSDAAVRDRIAAEHWALTGRRITIDALHLVRRPRAVAIPGIGHAARLQKLSSLPPRFALAGAWCGGGAMDDAARSGLAAAHRVTA
ncbi:MAG: FAD-dependent oxidoreductase [Deltaproteobacteria bacterium]|nr:FAD-dependent oxidoreductase [Deltaproteobacteria bacterium]